MGVCCINVILQKEKTKFIYMSVQSEMHDCSLTLELPDGLIQSSEAQMVSYTTPPLQ